MTAVFFGRVRLWIAALGSALVACGGVSDEGLYGPSGQDSMGATGGTAGTSGACGITGTWATFVQVGVEWSSGTIKPGAGTVKQWILSERRMEGAEVIDDARACGIGA